MITTDVLPDRVEMRAYGSLTLADCKTFEDISDRQLQSQHRPMDLFIDLRSMTECSFDVAVEELRFVRQHRGDFNRVAVLTDDQLVTWSVWLSQFFTAADMRIFDTERAARRWLDGVDLLEDEADAEAAALEDTRTH
ncbi:MAG: STAS/SEC14 domain-containing protein [Candidatus Dactylopiibacterium sp.]|nr:STAS/SEC14 domain-containing protein [Candidatus Dactylopiibacterium sp.]